MESLLYYHLTVCIKFIICSLNKCSVIICKTVSLVYVLSCVLNNLGICSFGIYIVEVTIPFHKTVERLNSNAVDVICIIGYTLFNYHLAICIEFKICLRYGITVGECKTVCLVYILSCVLNNLCVVVNIIVISIMFYKTIVCTDLNTIDIIVITKKSVLG